MTKEGVLELEQQQQQQQQHRQQQQGSPPAKKRRPLPLDTANTTTNAETQRSPNVNNVTIAELNQQAMNLYQRGEFGTASTLFREAVTLRMKESTGARECLADVCNPINSSIQQQPQQNIPPRHSYIYQRTEFDEGMNVYAETLPIQPDGHSDEVQATLLFNAGQARRKLNDLEGASQLYDRALETFLAPGKSIAIIQTEYPIIIPLLHNIGQLTYCNGNLEEAIQIYEVALRHAKKIHSEDDISVGLTLNCLGVLCYHLSTDRSDLARTYFEQALTILNRVLGHDSFASATTYNNLGRVHVQREEFTEALENYEKSLKIRERLGTEHIDYAASAFNAGQGYHQLGQFDRALKLYQRFRKLTAYATRTMYRVSCFLETTSNAPMLFLLPSSKHRP